MALERDLAASWCSRRYTAAPNLEPAARLRVRLLYGPSINNLLLMVRHGARVCAASAPPWRQIWYGRRVGASGSFMGRLLRILLHKGAPQRRNAIWRRVGAAAASPRRRILNRRRVGESGSSMDRLLTICFIMACRGARTQSGGKLAQPPLHRGAGS